RRHRRAHPADLGAARRGHPGDRPAVLRAHPRRAVGDLRGLQPHPAPGGTGAFHAGPARLPEGVLMSGVAFVFPGMGPAGTGEAVAFMRGDPVAGELAGRASDTLGYDVAERFAEGDHDYSEAAQVVFLVNCLAL